MSLSDIQNPETVLTLAATALGAVWTFFKSSDWFERIKRRKLDRALEILETAVEETYRTYVEAITLARADGKLTSEERRKARELARNRAIAIGRAQGVDVLAAVGREQIDLWIAKLVKGLKGG